MSLVPLSAMVRVLAALFLIENLKLIYLATEHNFFREICTLTS